MLIEKDRLKRKEQTRLQLKKESNKKVIEEDIQMVENEEVVTQ